MNASSEDEMLQLARDLYVLKSTPGISNDGLQQQARDMLNMAIQFFRVVQAERALGSIWRGLPGPAYSPPASPTEKELLAEAHHHRHPPPDSTNSEDKPTPGQTVGPIGVALPEMEPPEGRGLPSSQSQDQSRRVP